MADSAATAFVKKLKKEVDRYKNGVYYSDNDSLTIMDIENLSRT